MDAKILMQDLAAGVAQRSGLLKKESETFVRLFFETIEESLSEEKNVKVKGLGTFKIVEVSGRDSVNINTGERIHIKGHSKITFTPDTGLRDFVNRPFADFETIVLNDGVDMEKMEYTGEPEMPAGLSEPIVEEQEPIVEEPVAEVVEAHELVVEMPAPVVEAPTEVVKEPTEVVEETPAEVVEPVAEVEDSAEEVIETVAEKVEEPVAVVEETVTETEEPVTEEPAESVSEPVIDEPSGAMRMLKYVCFVVVVLLLMVGSYLVGTSSLSFGYFTIGKVKPAEEPKTEAVVEKPVVKKEPAKVEVDPKVEPKAEPFDSATVNGRYPYGAYEICGVQCTHVVAEGEDIEQIAKQYLKSKSNKVYVAAMNDLNVYRPTIEVGQELIIPEIRMKKFKRK